MKKSIKVMSMLAAAAMLCMSVTGCQNTAENEQVIAYNNAEFQV